MVIAVCITGFIESISTLNVVGTIPIVFFSIFKARLNTSVMVSNLKTKKPFAATGEHLNLET